MLVTYCFAVCFLVINVNNNHGLFQLDIFIYFFTISNIFILYRISQEYSSTKRLAFDLKPSFLCLGRTKIRNRNDIFYLCQLRLRPIDKQVC